MMTFRWGNPETNPEHVPLSRAVKTGFGNSSHCTGHWDLTIRKMQTGTDHTAPKRLMGRFLICPLLATGIERGGLGYNCFWAR